MSTSFSYLFVDHSRTTEHIVLKKMEKGEKKKNMKNMPVVEEERVTIKTNTYRGSLTSHRASDGSMVQKG